MADHCACEAQGRMCLIMFLYFYPFCVFLVVEFYILTTIIVLIILFLYCFTGVCVCVLVFF